VGETPGPLAHGPGVSACRLAAIAVRHDLKPLVAGTSVFGACAATLSGVDTAELVLEYVRALAWPVVGTR
jgi:hypothetical protein